MTMYRVTWTTDIELEGADATDAALQAWCQLTKQVAGRGTLPSFEVVHQRRSAPYADGCGVMVVPPRKRERVTVDLEDAAAGRVRAAEPAEMVCDPKRVATVIRQELSPLPGYRHCPDYERDAAMDRRRVVASRIGDAFLAANPRFPGVSFLRDCGVGS